MNLKLDSNNDLCIDRGAVRTRGLPYIAQLIKCKLQTIKGEWELNRTIGIPWFDDLLKHDYNLDLIYSWIHKTLLSVDGVTAVDDILLAVDTHERKLVVGFVVSTIYGSLSKTTKVGV